jgi:hypothetical protein
MDPPFEIGVSVVTIILMGACRESTDRIRHFIIITDVSMDFNVLWPRFAWPIKEHSTFDISNVFD